MQLLPCHIFRFVFATSLRHQLSLALLGAAIFLLELGPLEMQRRIVDILAGHPVFGPVAILCPACAAIVGVLMLGGWYVVHSEMEIGSLVAFVSAIGRLNDPWGDLFAYFANLTSAQAKYRLFADEYYAMAERSA